MNRAAAKTTLEVLLSVASGVLVFVAFPNWNVHFTAWFALVPLLIAARDASWQRGFVYGLVAGTVTNAGGFHWMVGMLQEFGHMPWPVAASILGLQSVTQGLTMALGVALWRALATLGVPSARAAWLSLWAGEAVVPMIFPWHMGNGITSETTFIQAADLGGVHLLSAVLYASNAAIAELAQAGLARRWPSWRFLVGSAAAAMALYGYGLLRIPQVDSKQAAARTLKIGLAEGDIGIWEKEAKHLRGREKADTLRHNLIVYQRLSRQLEEAGAELIVWPESAYIPYGPIPTIHSADAFLVIGDGGAMLRHDGDHLRPVAVERLGLHRASDDGGVPGLLTGLSSPRGDLWRFVESGRRVHTLGPHGAAMVTLPPGEVAVDTATMDADLFGRVRPGLVVARSGRAWLLPWPGFDSGTGVALPSPQTHTELVALADDTPPWEATAAAASGSGRHVIVGRKGAIRIVRGDHLVSARSPTDADLWDVAADPLGSEVVAVGADGTVVRSAAFGWQRERAGKADLYAAFYDHEGRPWAVGRGGAVFRRTGSGRWRSVPFPEQVDLLGGAADHRGRILLIGRGGRAFERSVGGKRFREVESGDARELTAVHGFQAQASYDIERGVRRLPASAAALPADDVPYPDDVHGDDGRVGEPDRNAPRRGFDVPLLFGAITQSGAKDPESGRCLECYNSALLLGRDGEVLGLYDKAFLLMFGEFIPFGDTFPWLYDLIPEASRFRHGTRPSTMRLGDARLGVLICYEDLLPRFVLRAAAGDPHVFINMTNDAWFGQSAEPYHHLQLAQLRAVEHRRWLVRSTNTGVSVFVDAVGRRVQETSLTSAETLMASVPLLEGRTIYAVLGDWPLGVLLVVGLLSWARAYRRRIGSGSAGRGGRGGGRARKGTARPGKKPAKKRKAPQRKAGKRKPRASDDEDGEIATPSRLA